MNDTPKNLQDAKKELAGYGMTINRQESGELRVDYKPGTKGHVRGAEGSSYHAADLEDGVKTARAMRDTRDRQPEATSKLAAMVEKSNQRGAEHAARAKPEASSQTLSR